MELVFPGQKEDEKILAIVHKHFVVYVKIIAVFFLVFVFPAALFVYFWFSAYPIEKYPERDLTAGIFCCVFVLYGILFTVIRWLDEEFDIFIVTTERLIDMTQISFFRRTVSSASLDQIQDTTSSVGGLFPTLFHYGNLTVQTAGATSSFFIDRVSNPDFLAQKILNWAKKKKGGLSLDEDVIFLCKK